MELVVQVTIHSQRWMWLKWVIKSIMSLNMDAKIGITVGSTWLEWGNDFADEVIVNKVAASSSHVCKTLTKSRICTYSNTKNVDTECSSALGAT